MQTIMMVPVDIAEAYAAWAGKRLPTEEEWTVAVTTLGSERLDCGRIWKWTATRYERGGRIVRGGRWRDQPQIPPVPSNRSFETNAAGDVGFRCVVNEDETEPISSGHRR